MYSTTLLSVSSVASITMLNQSLQAINTDFSWRVTNRSKSNNGYLQIEESFVIYHRLMTSTRIFLKRVNLFFYLKFL
ncbi:hypothetical protein [Spiroplasma endosymbiont of Dilophus febrilis]|uniref:hypothetical protein n=1 Tax=Spiroplasma endosymbiont of Dilophus febrilis TaxID=3066292 RepID=UPI00313E30ED